MNLKDRYIIKCFGPDEMKYYLQDERGHHLTVDPDKAKVYKNKNRAQSVCDFHNSSLSHKEHITLNGEIIPKNWSLDVIKSYIEES